MAALPPDPRDDGEPDTPGLQLALTLPVGSASLPPSADLTLYASFGTDWGAVSIQQRTRSSGVYTHHHNRGGGLRSVTVSRIEKVSSNYPDAETAIEEDRKQAAVSFTSSSSEPLVGDLVIRAKLAADIGCDAPLRNW